MKVFIRVFLFLILLIGAGVGLVSFYPYLFAREITGLVMGVQPIDVPYSMLAPTSANAPPKPKLSFSVAIKDKVTSEILTGSTEDGQWAVVKEGQCATAKFFPHPPWDLQKAGSYFGTRLIRLYEICP